MSMIIQTSDNRFYRVTETGSADLAHVWNGIEVKHAAGRWSDKLNGNVGPHWAPKKNAREQLVRKAASKIIIA